MSYGVFILRGAGRQLAGLPSEAYTEVRDSIRALAVDPLPPQSMRIANRDGWHVRVGKYRVIYEVDSRAGEVTVLEVGQRSDV